MESWSLSMLTESSYLQVVTWSVDDSEIVLLVS